LVFPYYYCTPPSLFPFFLHYQLSPIHSDHTNPRYAYPHLYTNTTTITQFSPPQPLLFFFLHSSIPSHLFSSSIYFFFLVVAVAIAVAHAIFCASTTLTCAYLNNSDPASELFIRLNNLRSREFRPGFDALLRRDWVQISAFCCSRAAKRVHGVATPHPVASLCCTVSLRWISLFLLSFAIILSLQSLPSQLSSSRLFSSNIHYHIASPKLTNRPKVIFDKIEVTK